VIYSSSHELTASSENTQIPEIDNLDNITQTIGKQRKVSKIIVLFDDGTFQEM
jgi:hypothetical protein